MTTLATDWLRQLSRAVSTRQLYPADHPRVVEAVGMLADLAHQLTADGSDASLFMLEDRLACNGVLVPGDGAAIRAFEMIQAHGRDRITLKRGVDRSELAQLVATLAAKEALNDKDPSRAEHRLRATTHVRFSVFDAEPGETVLAPVVSLSGLGDLWRLIDEQHTFDMETLEKLLAPLAQVADSRHASLVPLTALKSHDDYTATHISNVAVLTMALADRLGLPPAFVRQVGVAALLHDIGKMKIPAEILNYPGQLTTEQVSLIRRHPEVGAEMLMNTPGVPQLAVVVAFEHHLQADGGGYPDVPRGWQIHLASAMTHVADVYDALRSNRPYRKGWPHEQIVEVMARDRDTVFPGDLLDAFLLEVAPCIRSADAPVESNAELAAE
jgi:putative nucleotidyltransferase with HDIG domain